MLSAAPIQVTRVPVAQLFPSTLRSPLAGVSDAAWFRLVRALDVQAPDATSKSGALGSYAMPPRRLVELGYARHLRRVRHRNECDFLPPWTRERFLADLVGQHESLAQSLRRYAEDLRSGKLRQPDGVSMAGALAILHAGGPPALAGYPRLFDHTRARYLAARGAF